MHTARLQPTRPAAIRIAAAVLHGCERLIAGLVALAGLVVLIGGIPWGLWHYIGWPLPDHVPTWDEVQATLLSPMSTQLLLDVLACVLWPVWAKFTLDVALSVSDAIRRAPRFPHHVGPMRTAASIIVGAIVFALLGNRAVPVYANPSTVAAIQHIPPTMIAADDAEQPPAPIGPPGTAIVRPPQDGVYDSLWRIAERELGDGKQWPAIWHLNKGATQVDGRVFTNPNLIRPGWILRLPEIPQSPVSQPPPPHEHKQNDGTAAPPSTPTSAPSTTNPPQTNDSPPPTTATPSPAQQPGTGIAVPTGAFVGLGLAALITVALMTVRLWRRRTYRPGSGDREELTVAPVVRALRIAHDDLTLPHDDQRQLPGRDPSGTSDVSQELAVRERARATAESVLPRGNGTIVGLRDGHELALDLARTRGFGLVGPGAIAAIRALLVCLLAQGQRSRAGQPVVVVPAGDVAMVLGDDTDVHHPPAHLRIVDDLDTALGVVEAELLTRARHQFDPDDEQPGALVLVATPDPRADRRLQAVLDNGSTLGIASILIGQWRPGGTVRVRTDGTISATSPNIADALTGTRLFTLPSDDTSELLDLLGTAEQVITPQHGVQHQHTAQRAARPGDPPRSRSLSTSKSASDTAAQTGHEQRESATSDRRGGEGEPVAKASLELTVLGRMHLYHRGADDSPDLIDVVAPKQREILAYLALHPDGVRRDVLTATIWPEAPASRPANSFHATLSQLRKALRKATKGAITDLAINRDGHCRLDQAVVDVDLWHLRQALDSYRHDPEDPRQQQALHEALPLYGGELADGLMAEWLDDPREVLRRDVLDAIGVVAHRVADDDPHQHLALLERARELDPYNEATYCAIMRAQARLGQHDAVPRTLTLLTTALAAIEQQPSPETIALCESLQQSNVLAHE